MGFLWFGSSWERDVDDSRFDLIDIDQFRNHKFKTLFNYLTLWVLLILQVVFYGVDVYTCVKLLAFNEWTSQVKPFLSLRISKWLFAGCIIASIVLLIYDASKGIKVFSSKNISLTYSNSFARTLRSITSYKRFCVLNEINPSSGFDKIAFFTYFQIIDCKKLLIADSPRQVINALTLYSVLHVRSGFLDAIKDISTTNRSEAVILYSMSISFFIWLFFISEFAIACIFTVPVYYNVLHVRRFQTLRQYVCVQVNNTVKALAKGHQRKNLGELAKENMKKNYYPRLPDVDPFSPRDNFKPKPYKLNKNNTFDYNNEKQQGVITKGSTFDSERNPFADRNQIRKPPTQQFALLSQPAQVYQSKTSLNSQFVEPTSIYQTQANFSTGSVDSLVFEPSIYPERVDSKANLLHNQSKASLEYPERFDSFAEKEESYPNRFDSLHQEFKSYLPQPKTSQAPTLPYEQNKIPERRWVDEEAGILTDPFDSLSVDEDNEDDSLNDMQQHYPEETHEQRMKRVRESLITRVRQMEDEDYSKFRPVSPHLPVLQEKSKKKKSNKDRNRH